MFMGIFSEIFAAIASAPVMAAGAGTKGLGDAVQIGSKDIPLLNTAGSMLSYAGEQTMAGATSMRDGIGDMASLMPHVDFSGLGRSIAGITSSLTPGNQQLSQSLVRAPEITSANVGPQSVTTANHFNPAELFTASVSAPVFSQAPIAANTRMV
jgi:hypothetical protein